MKASLFFVLLPLLVLLMACTGHWAGPFPATQVNLVKHPLLLSRRPVCAPWGGSTHKLHTLNILLSYHLQPQKTHTPRHVLMCYGMSSWGPTQWYTLITS